MNRSFFIIANGQAAQRKPRLFVSYAQRLKALGITGEIHVTNHRGHATELAKKAWAEGARKFVSMGGDGTQFEIINGLLPLSGKEKPVLALLPMGTGNSFLRDFSMTNDGDHTFSALKEGRVSPCDAILAEHTQGSFYFMNLLSMGFVADVAFLRNSRFSHLGDLGYVLGVFLKTLQLKVSTYAYTLDGHAQKAQHVFLSFNNSQYTGGKMRMAPDASVHDGYIDLIAVNAMGRVELLKTFPKIFSGTHVAHAKVSQTKLQSATFSFTAPVPLMVDGETFECQLQSLKILPSALELVA